MGVRRITSGQFKDIISISEDGRPVKTDPKPRKAKS